MPPNGQSGLPPAYMYQACIPLSYIIDSEIRPLTTQRGKGPCCEFIYRGFICKEIDPIKDGEIESKPILSRED